MSTSTATAPLGTPELNGDVTEWQATARQYKAAAEAKIPGRWRLSPEVLSTISETSDRSVLDVPQTCGILTPEELDITENHDACDLVGKLATGQLSSVAVTTAFCKRAAVAQQLTNCLTETFFDQALERAYYCDEYLAREGQPIGPFHGLPISLKDSFKIKGIQSSIGYVSFLSKGPEVEHSALVQILLSLGAVLYVKTNIPQTLMTADSHNNIFGRVLNPHRLSLTAGGSSGGEGALLAMKGSVLGVGTDIAGSIRIPAYVNGTIGFKPSARRVPYSGQQGPGRVGSFGVPPVAGPLARSVRDVAYFMEHVLAYDTWSVDSNVIPSPWRRITSPVRKPLRFGVLLEDAQFPVHPPVLRHLNLAISSLERAGHEVISLSEHLPGDFIATAFLTAFTFFSLDTSGTHASHIHKSGEPIVPSVTKSRIDALFGFKPTLDDAFQVHARMYAMREQFRKAFVGNGLDAVLCATYQGAGAPHDTYGTPPYTVWVNLLDLPACTLPFGKAEKSLDRDFVKDVAYSPPYRPDAVEGAPCGIQLVGRYMKDEELVPIAQAVVEALQRDGK